MCILQPRTQKQAKNSDGAPGRSVVLRIPSARTAPPGREPLTWLVPPPHKHQKQQRHTGLTSTPWVDSVACLEVELLKADVLRGQREFTQKSSAALQSCIPREGPRSLLGMEGLISLPGSGEPGSTKCLRASDLASAGPKGLRLANGSSLLSPHLRPGVLRRSTAENATALQEKRWEEKEGGGEVRKQWVEALSLHRSLTPSLSKQVRLELIRRYQSQNSLSAHAAVPSVFQPSFPNHRLM